MKNRVMKSWVAMLLLTLAFGCASSHSNLQNDPAANARQAMAELTEGTKLLSEKKYDEAEGHFRRALQFDSYSGLAHNNLGMVYFNLGNLYDAANEFQAAGKLLPSYPEPRNKLGLTLEAGDKFDEAIAEYQAAVDLDPENPELLGNLVRAKVRRGDQDQHVRELLVHLMQIETRPEWQLWEQRELSARSR